MHYRPELDGLRAIAVAAVIAEHAGAPLRGGFLGVDIFFVLSGFLITRILMADLEAGRFGLTRFYIRRARRILPALLVVVAACLPFAWLLMTPDQLRAFGQSLVALSVFSTNVLFWQQSGYFAPDSGEVALLHTWSLAVEEQFYLLFPLALAALWRRGPRVVLWGLVAAALLSLSLAEAAARTMPQGAFYLLPFRAWELLAGSLAALWVARRGVAEGWRAQALSALGAVMVLGPLAVYHPWLPIPGVWLLVPVLGTVLVLTHARPGTAVAYILSRPPLVGLGLISYSAYLWHQPVFAFARIGRFDPPGELEMAGLVALTLGLAVLSWKLVEQPFRDAARIGPRWFASLMVPAGGLVLALGLAAHWGQGFGETRFGSDRLAALATSTPSPLRSECHRPPERALAPGEACVYFAEVPPRWAVFGDSHAVEIAYALAEGLAPRGQSLVHLSASGCPPALAFDPGLPGCAAWVRESLDWLEGQSGIETVVLVWRHSAYLFGRNDADYPALPDRPYRITNPGTAEDKRMRYWRSLQSIVKRLEQAGRRVIVVAPVPEIARPIAKYILHRDPAGPRLPTVTRAYYDARNAWVRRRLAALDVEILDPAHVLCDARQCYGTAAGAALYFDDDHLSLAGARHVVAPLLEARARVALPTRGASLDPAVACQAMRSAMASPGTAC